MVTATHAERRLALRAVLDGCGYGQAEIAEAFPIWMPGRGETIRADYVAFTRSDQHDMSTSAIVAHVVDGQADIRQLWLPAAAALAAPAVLIALPDRLTAWTSATNESAAGEVASVPVTAPREMVGRLAMLTPEFVANAKMYGFQGTLFPLDIGLLPESRSEARSYLTDIVEHALARVSRLDDSGHDELTPKLVIGALATLMIRDKTKIHSIAHTSTAALIDIAQQMYRGYFDWLTELSSVQFDAFTELVNFISAQINFAGLEPAMVSHVYEQALITHRRRREQGIYYTPPQLADQMLRMLPLEHLEPQRRRILDPACGSGTILLSAANRLTQMQTDYIDPLLWHQYLTSHLRGFDRDPFATEITRLCLLMTALPIGNSWQVETVDTLDVNISPSDRPSVIISNPPWQYLRAGESTAERANIFLTWMLDNLADDGFLACVVPLSWLNRDNSRRSREALLQRATLLEVWRLPASIFPRTRSTTAPAVIIAHKNKDGHVRGRVTLVKTVRDSSLSVFYSTGSAEEAYLVDPGSDGNRLMRGLLTRAVENMDNFTSIGEIAEVHNGTPARPRRPSRTRDEATHYELGSLRSLREFGEISEGDLVPVRYPEDYHHANPSDARVRAHKVVVTAKNFSTRNPWRVAVGYDLFGASLREMFHMVLPRDHWEPWIDLDEWERFCSLMAVLGSGFAACWIDENEPTRNISPERVARIPFPADSSSIAELARVGDLMARVVRTGDLKRTELAAIELEQTVNAVYNLSSDLQRLIAERLAGAEAPEGVVRYHRSVDTSGRLDLNGDRADIPSYGYVFDADENGLRLWISGATEDAGIQVPALPQIPGWLCEGDSDFRIDGNLKDLTKARFRFHLYDWLTGEDLTRPGLTSSS